MSDPAIYETAPTERSKNLTEVPVRHIPLPDRPHEKMPRAAGAPPPRAAQPARDILRFRRSERMLHWAIAVPYVICWLSACVLVLVYNPDPQLPGRDLFSVLHRISAVGLIVLPPVAMLKNRKDYRIHLYNIKSGWLWTLNDFKWLALMGLAAISSRFKLPEQGKFNAAEKVNFMSVMVAGPIFILTGLMIWTQTAAWAAWLVHGILALLVTPTMLGHIYMATVNPDTRTGLSGMFSGYVDRQWARHHYALWYKEHFEKKVQAGEESKEMIHPPDHKIHVHCPSCGESSVITWSWLVHKIFTARVLHCPHCGETISALSAVTDQKELEWIKRRLELNRMSPTPAV
jgi:formate dehydrogenase subunit gamma